MRRLMYVIDKINIKIDVAIINLRILYIRMQIFYINTIRDTSFLPISVKLRLINARWLKKENIVTKTENI